MSTSTTKQQGINSEEFIKHVKVTYDPANQNVILKALLPLVSSVLLAFAAALERLVALFRAGVYSVERKTTFRGSTPQQIRHDVRGFPKIPAHVAFVLPTGGIEQLIRQTVECLSWAIGAGVGQVTVYERSGVLKKIDTERISAAISTGIGALVAPSDLPKIVLARNKVDASNTLTVTLSSEEDGRPLLVELANEYRSEYREGHLDPASITVDGVHQKVRSRAGDEPDLLVMFGSRIDTQQFSPWLLRVTELFCLPDNEDVFHYMVFYRALEKFADVKVNLGA